MKRSIITALTVLAIFAYAVPSSAVPRLQTYIVDSQYRFYNGNLDFFTWVSNSSTFDLKVVGYWDDAFSCEGIPTAAPSYDFMDCYLAMSVPRNQAGSIFINGVEISSFNNWYSAMPAGTDPSLAIPLTGPSIGADFNFLNIGRIDNDQVNALHYGYGSISTPGWGDEIMMNVVVRGFEWAHFDAIGVDALGNTFTNSQFHDSSYSATPEPSTLSLLGLGLLGIAPLLRKKKR